MFSQCPFLIQQRAKQKRERKNRCEWINEKAIVDKHNGMALYETNKFGK